MYDGCGISKLQGKGEIGNLSSSNESASFQFSSTRLHGISVLQNN